MTLLKQELSHIQPLNPGIHWVLILMMFAATVVAQLANVAYESTPTEFADKIVPSLVFLSLLTLPAIAIGTFLGRKLGLGLFNSKAATPSKASGVNFAVFTAILLGAFLLLLRWLTMPYLPSEIPEYGFRGAIGGLLVSIGAAIGEEIWFRFGLMTFMLWGVSKVTHQSELSDKLVLLVIIIVGFGFGLAHLPQLNSFDAATTFAIWATILGNIAVSVLYGWCYWRYGLLSAMVAHFTVDIVLHVLPALY